MDTTRFRSLSSPKQLVFFSHSSIHSIQSLFPFFLSIPAFFPPPPPVRVYNMSNQILVVVFWGDLSTSAAKNNLCKNIKKSDKNSRASFQIGLVVIVWKREKEEKKHSTPFFPDGVIDILARSAAAVGKEEWPLLISFCAKIQLLLFTPFVAQAAASLTTNNNINR